MQGNETSTPVRTAIAGKGGVVPPTEHRFQKGNKHGHRDTAGAIIKNYLNGFARRKLRTSRLRAIESDESKPHLMRVAAARLLMAKDEGQDFDRIIEHTDGRPKPTTDVNINVILRTPDDRAAEATQAADRLRAILNPSAN